MNKAVATLLHSIFDQYSDCLGCYYFPSESIFIAIVLNLVGIYRVFYAIANLRNECTRKGQSKTFRKGRE